MKKLFKNILMQCFFALSVFSMVGCQEYEMDSQPEQPINMQVDAKEAYTMLATSPSNIAFGISSNTPWSIETDQQWCKVTPSSSAVSSLVQEVVISAESNETAKERTATITIKGEGIETAKVISITQKSKENLVVVKPSDPVSTEGGKLVISLISNKPWEIFTEDGFLNDIDIRKGEGDESGEYINVTINVPANVGAARSGIVTVKTIFEEVPVEIKQNGVVIEMAEPTESGNLEFSNDVTEQIYEIKSNQEWKIKKGSASWIKAEKTAEGQLKVTLDRNPLLIERTGEIVLETEKYIDGFEGVTFKVVQGSSFKYNGKPEEIIVDEATGNVKIVSKLKNAFESFYLIKKGTVTVDFGDVHFTDKQTMFNFNFYPTKVTSASTSNFFWQFMPGRWTDVTFKVGGGINDRGGMNRNSKFSIDLLNTITKLEFHVEPDTDLPGRIQIRTTVYSGNQVILEDTYKDLLDVWAANPTGELGSFLYLSLQGTANDYYTIKSITYKETK